MDLTTEQNLIRNLVHNEDFSRFVTPFLKHEYFDNGERVVFDLFEKFFITYNARPSVEALYVELSNQKDLPEKIHEEAKCLIDLIRDNTSADDTAWLKANTLEFCKEKALYNAMSECISIMDNKKSEKPRTAIPEILSDALAVTFNEHLGHDYLGEAERRFERIQTRANKIDFDLDDFNRITNGGVERKTLNMILAGTNVGKSLMMCHFAASDIAKGRNVLYITLEMEEDKIGNRIDANLLNIPLTSFQDLPKDIFMEKFEALRKRIPGRLIIEEYPTGTAHVGHFRHLLRELKLKQKFVPDVIYIDYINICASSRMKMSQTNSYGYIKAIAEEVRGLMGEPNNCVGWSATQTNREGFANSDPTLTATSDSFGLPFTADFMVAAVTTPELAQLGHLKILDLKNRYGPKANPFVVGVDINKMRLYNVTKQENILVDQSTGEILKPTSQEKKKFGGIKV